MTPNKNYPPEVIEKLLDNQVLQGNPRDASVFQDDIELHKAEGGVNWTETPEGEQFWHEVLLNRNFRRFAQEYPITARGWLEVLPTEIKEKALQRTKAVKFLDKPVYSLKVALQGLFLWSNTPEKFNYWNAIATKNN